MNKQLIFKKRPVGLPDADTWNLETNEIPELKEGEVLIQNHYISLDPAMRGWMNDKKSYIEPVALGDVMRAGSIGKVVKANNHPKFNIGDCIVGWGGVQQYLITNGDNCYKVNDSIAPMSKYLGVLGMPGMTAYFGILEVGKIKEGDIVLVSGAAGAVGSVVGQIAKIKGCTVIGIAGGKQKCDYLLSDLGFDVAIDYKSENIFTALKEKCAKGIDVYFDLYLSSSHHVGEVTDHEGFIYISLLPDDYNIGNLNKILKYIDIKAGHFELDFGNQHLFRSDNADVQRNPLIGNYIVDANTVAPAFELRTSLDSPLNFVADFQA